VKAMSTTQIKRVNREWRRRTPGSLSVALVNLSNPFNVGSIYRTAAVLGVETVYLVGATPGPEQAKVHKTGLGTEHGVETVRVETLGQVPGRRIAVELAEGATPMHEFAFHDGDVIVLGSEGHGLPPSALGACAAAVFVPQPGKVASLNVAMAATLAMDEVRRQDWTATAP
jgi:tRNA (guanosine-2'-O-)-methyltransferase